MDKLTEKLTRNKRYLIWAFASALFWMVLTHGYCFAHSNFSHDSLREFNSTLYGNDLKIGIGRFLTPVYRAVFQRNLTFPWLVGALSILWAGGTVFFVSRVFRMESRLMVFLTAGILTTNISVSALAATFVHDLDCNLFAVMCAAGAAYLWRSRKWGAIPGSILLAVSLGIYQDYLFIAVTLVMFACILDLLDGTVFREVFLRGLKAIGMVLAGGALYYLMMTLNVRLSGRALYTENYNSVVNVFALTPGMLPRLMKDAYRDCITRLWNAHSSYPPALVRGIHVGLGALSVFAVGVGLLRQKKRILEKLLCLALLVLLPLAMNMTYVLTMGDVHELMGSAIWLVYLLALLLCSWLRRQWREPDWQIVLGKLQKAVCVALTAAVLYGNVQFANGMYLKKDLEHDAFLSLMTRIVYRVEDFPGYVPGETPVVFVGYPLETEAMEIVMPGFGGYMRINGLWNSDAILISNRGRFQAYLDYTLGLNMNLVEDALWKEIRASDFAASMPRYPDQGCIAFRDGILVVKLGG